MDDPIVIVTGARGFIGRNLVRHFRAHAWKVRALVRDLPEEKVVGVEYVRSDLSQPPDASVFGGAQFLVHCAYVRHEQDPDSDRLNLEGTRLLINLCRRSGTKPLFLSSLSAHEKAESHYGRNKRQIEALFDPARDLVLRPGLVIGRAGLFGGIVRTISNHKFVPLVGGGQPVQAIAINDLCLVIKTGLERGICGTYRIADPTALELREVYRTIAGRKSGRTWLVPVPIWAALWACRLAEAFRLRLPVSSDSVLGLRRLRRFDTAADVRAFGLTLKPFRECLANLPPSDSFEPPPPDQS